MSDLLQKTFRFDIPVKAFEKSDRGERSWRIGGFVSTDHLDQQNEILLQEGLDFGPFMKKGFFNDNHSQSSGSCVGYPDTLEMRNTPDGHRGWYVEGYLLKHAPVAQNIWGIVKSLEADGNPRQYGFSVEGAVTDREHNGTHDTVRKAVVKHVAVTHCPINTAANLVTLAKSLSMGTGPAAVPGTVATGSGAGAVLAMESLEDMTPEQREKYQAALAKRRLLTVKKSDAVGYLTAHGIPRNLAEAAINGAIVRS